MALGLTQPLAGKSTSNISWGVKVSSTEDWQPHHFHVPIVLKSLSPSLLETSGPVQACYRDCFTFAFMTNIDENHDKSALNSFFTDRDLNFAVLNTGLEHCCYACGLFNS